MFCPSCGRKNDAASVYCDQCGARIEPPVPVNRQSVPYNMPYAQPGGYPQDAQVTPPYAPQTYYAPQFQPQAVKKNRTGLIIGLALGTAAVIAGVALIVSLTDSPAVVGTWYCEERGTVLEFQKSSFVVSHTVEGNDEGNYTFYDDRKKGVITADDNEFEFSLDGRQITVDDVGTFKRANSSFDTEEFLDSNSD